MNLWDEIQGERGPNAFDLVEALIARAAARIEQLLKDERGAALALEPEPKE